MRTSFGGRRLPAALSSKILAPPPDSDLQPVHNAKLRRRIRNPALPGTASGVRARKGFSVAGGRRSGPRTPLLRWKFSEKPPSESVPRVGSVGDGVPPLPRVSARKLAAGIWHLRPLDVRSSSGGGYGGGCPRDGWLARQGRPYPVHLEVQLLHNPPAMDLHTHTIKKKNEHSSPVSVLSPKSGEFQKVKQFSGFPCSALEKATKWDPESSMTLDEVYRFYSRLNFDDQEAKAVSLRSELEHAHGCIAELENEKRSAKRKLDHFLKRLAQEKAMWRSREHEKIRAIIDGMKDELNKERKKRQRMEVINSKLVDELAEAKLSVKRFLQDCEKERKARELIEEVCDELAKEIGEDKAGIEALKMEAMRIREEVEEDKRMLQMAEVWREERVHMKLIDAKLTLEEKYSEIVNLKAELEAFLGASTNWTPDVASVREAELLRQKTEALNVEEIKEFVYHPPSASEDIYAIFEELQPKQEADEREIEPCTVYSHASHPSQIEMASPETDVFLDKQRKQCANELIYSNDEGEDDSDWETASHAEEPGSSNSPDRSELSANTGYYKESNVSISGLEWEKNGNNKLQTETVKISSASTKQSRKKVPSIYRLWRSSIYDNVEDLKRTSSEVKNGGLSNGRLSDGTYTSTNGEDQRKVSVEIANGRLSHARYSNVSLSTEMGYGGVGSTSESIGQWSSPDSLHHHGARGLKGCIEWPRGNQKYSLKSKLMEARIESQKIQLRHVLKQKI